MSNEGKEIANKIETLKELNTKLDEFDTILDSFTQTDNTDFTKIMEEISPEERADLNWNLGYSTYTLYYIYLKLRNIDPRDHEIKDEIKRVQDFYTKIKEAKEKKEEDKLMQQNSNIHKEACDRMIKSLIQNKDDANKTRKVNKSTPLPDAVHLNWNKNIK